MALFSADSAVEKFELLIGVVSCRMKRSQYRDFCGDAKSLFEAANRMN
jgi:hypothetical protein